MALFKNTKKMMEKLEGTFKGIADVHEGIDLLIKGLDSLKVQKGKGLAKEIYRDLYSNVNAIQKSWKKTLKKVDKQYGDV
jgi:hypothetical protein